MDLHIYQTERHCQSTVVWYLLDILNILWNFFFLYWIQKIREENCNFTPRIWHNLSKKWSSNFYLFIISLRQSKSIGLFTYLPDHKSTNQVSAEDTVVMVKHFTHCMHFSDEKNLLWYEKRENHRKWLTTQASSTG